MAQVVNNLPPRQEIGLISGLERSPEENGYPLQYSSLENSVDTKAWWATVHGVAESQQDRAHKGSQTGSC